MHAKSTYSDPSLFSDMNPKIANIQLNKGDLKKGTKFQIKIDNIIPIYRQK